MCPPCHARSVSWTCIDSPIILPPSSHRAVLAFQHRMKASVWGSWSVASSTTTPGKPGPLHAPGFFPLPESKFLYVDRADDVVGAIRVFHELKLEADRRGTPPDTPQPLAAGCTGRRTSQGRNCSCCRAGRAPCRSNGNGRCEGFGRACACRSRRPRPVGPPSPCSLARICRSGEHDLFL